MRSLLVKYMAIYHENFEVEKSWSVNHACTYTHNIHKTLQMSCCVIHACVFVPCAVMFTKGTNSKMTKPLSLLNLQNFSSKFHGTYMMIPKQPGA